MRALAVALLLTGSTAHAAEYGDMGTLEIGGSFAAANTTADFGDEGGTTTTLSGTLQPFVGLFVMPSTQVFASADLAYSQVAPKDQDSVTSQLIGGAVGGAMLIGFGKARIGPSLSVRFVQETLTPEGQPALHVRSGPGAEVAALAKLQIGGGGIITLAAFASHDLLEDDENSFTRTSLGTRGAFSIFF